MEAANFFLVGALASAAGAGYFCLRAPMAHAYGSLLAAFALPTDARRKVMCQKIFVQGVRVLYPVATKLLLIKPVHMLVSDCMEPLREKGSKEVRAQALVSSVLASLVLFSLVVGLALRSALSGVAVVAALVALAVFRFRSQADKRLERLRLCVPDSIQGMKACFQAGFSLEQTLEYLSGHTCAEMEHVYGRALQTLRLGGTAADALDVLKREVNAPEFAFVIAALDIQHRTGGSLSSVFSSAEEAARGQFELERSLRTQTAQARLSARVVSVMPLVIIGVFSLITEGFLEPFFSSLAGFLLFLFAVAMQGLGVFMVRKTLRVKEVTS